MLIHSVYFWLKPELTEAQRTAFVGGLESLRPIKAVETVYIGTPAPLSERPVVDRSFSYALIISFKNPEAHDAYQIDPIHLKFVENFHNSWIKVQIYDAI